MQCVGIDNKASHSPHDEHGHGGDSGHGHGDHDTAFLLQNVRRWVAEAAEEKNEKISETDMKNLPEFAMYEILLSTMKHHFHHEREADTLSVGGMSRLYSAVGVANDLNDANLESIGRRTAGKSAPSIEVDFDAPQDDQEENPIIAAADSIVTFVDSGGNMCGNIFPADYFDHRMISMEVLFAFIEQLEGLSEVEKVGQDFHDAVDTAKQRCEACLANMQLQSPNTCKAIHTLLAFRTLVGEYKHRLHAFGEQGFLSDAYVEGSEHVVEGRKREVDQYIHTDLALQVFGLLTCQAFSGDHPVVSCYQKDAKHVQLEGSDAIVTTVNPATRTVTRVEAAADSPVQLEDPVDQDCPHCGKARASAAHIAGCSAHRR